MFGKLIKYEWKAVMRSMLPIYGALAAISVINAFLFSDLLTGNGAAAINLSRDSWIRPSWCPCFSTRESWWSWACLR